eukprot:COSAG01_NODE_63926_length_278_cov_0.843575_1_plen_36_part_10
MARRELAISFASVRKQLDPCRLIDTRLANRSRHNPN